MVGVVVMVEMISGGAGDCGGEVFWVNGLHGRSMLVKVSEMWW